MPYITIHGGDMRWDAISKTGPVNGEKRKVSEFAWLPLVVEDQWVWLESYWSQEIYIQMHDEWWPEKRYLK